MSATDELRQMLDERGVEWLGGLPTETIVREPIDILYVERSDGRMHVYFRSYFTPAQAIAATLGRERTCRFVDDSDGEFPPKCSACGYEPSVYECSWLGDGGYEFEGNYCPNCGAKVVDDD